jgi:hypothetical protein
MDESPSTTPSPISPILAPWMLSVVIGIVAYVTTSQVPLQSERPPADNSVFEPVPPSIPAIRPLHARLWEDPLIAALKDDQSRKEKPSETAPRSLPQRAAAQSAEAPTNLPELFDKLPKPLMVMPVLVTGEPYAEHREDRLRTQYALLTALGRCGYELQLPTRASYVKISIKTKFSSFADEIDTELVVPIKLFRPMNERSSKPPILVCWINETQLGVRPLAVKATDVATVL